jgi:hypothetical protein
MTYLVIILNYLYYNAEQITFQPKIIGILQQKKSPSTDEGERKRRRKEMFIWYYFHALPLFIHVL